MLREFAETLPDGDAGKEAIRAVLEKNERLRTEVDQRDVQLAGCSVAAMGGTSETVRAKQGDYGWSVAYQDVLNLRLRIEAALALHKDAGGWCEQCSSEDADAWAGGRVSYPCPTVKALRGEDDDE
jgi:hypothetical protein